MSLTVSSNFEIPASYKSSGAASADSSKPEVFSSAPQGTGDVAPKASKKHTNPKVIKMMPAREVVIKANENGVDALAYRLGLNPQDLRDQLRDMKDPKTGKPLIPEGYNFDAGHKKDLPWFKEGYKLKLHYPKTEAEKDNYEEFVQQRRTEYYNNKAKSKKIIDDLSKASIKSTEDAAKAAKPFWKFW